MGAETAWARAKGAGVKIAIVDSGVDLDHEDLTGKFVPGWDFIDDDNDPRDENGHGTHVAGIAAAKTFNGKGVAGMAPDASIMSVRVLGGTGFNVRNPDPDSLGQILASSAEAVRWAADNGAKVINLSLGGVACDPGSDESCGPSAALASAIEYAWSKGAICVVAAGNDSDTSTQPLKSGYTNQHALVVVATTQSDARASYSNAAGDAMWGVAAPGSSVLSSYYTYPIGDHREYDYLSGTSMAAPHVSGLAALLFSMGLTKEQVVDRIIGTAKDLGPAGKDTTFGYGRIDAAAATNISAPGGSGGGGTSGGGGSGGGRPKGSSPPARPSSPAATSPAAGGSPQPAPTISPDPASVQGEGSGPPSSGGLPLVAMAATVFAAMGGGWLVMWFLRRSAEQGAGD